VRKKSEHVFGGGGGSFRREKGADPKKLAHYRGQGITTRTRQKTQHDGNIRERKEEGMGVGKIQPFGIGEITGLNESGEQYTGAKPSINR